MLTFATRFLGYVALAVAMVIGVLDGSRSIADGTVQASSLGMNLDWLAPKALPSLSAAVSRLVHPLAWDPLLRGLLLTPAVPALFVLGLVLLLVARRTPEAVLPPD